jgi:hypothetical protein
MCSARAVATAARPSALREIAERAKLTPSRAHRYLAGLVAVGLVKQDGTTGQYDIGEKLTEFGLRAVGRADPASIGAEMLVRLSSVTGMDSHPQGSLHESSRRWRRSSRSGLGLLSRLSGYKRLMDRESKTLIARHLKYLKGDQNDETMSLQR